MSINNLVPRTVWDLASSGLGTTINANGNSGPKLIDLLDVADVWLAVYVAGTATGTSPTLDVHLDVQDPDGNWFTQVAKITQITTAPASQSVSAGLHIAANQIVLPRWARISWTVGGTTPVYPQVSITLTGR